MKLSQPEFLLDKGIWYYATPSRIELAIHCHSNYWHNWEHVKNETLEASGRIRIDLGCKGMSKNIHLMPTSLNIWAKGRNMTFKQEIIPKMAIEQKLVSLPTVKKINISKIMENSTNQDLMQLSAQLMLIKDMDVDYNTKLIYYSEWSYGSAVLAFIALIA